MIPSTEPNWDFIRERAKAIHPNAFQFVQEGLQHTAERVHGEGAERAAAPAPAAPSSGRSLEGPRRTDSRHVNGRELCMGLRDLAIRKYGMMAPTVLRRWGLERTEDFGVIVYSMIEQKQMRRSDDDRFEHFAAVFDFEEAFAPDQTWGN